MPDFEKFHVSATIVGRFQRHSNRRNRRSFENVVLFISWFVRFHPFALAQVVERATFVWIRFLLGHVIPMWMYFAFIIFCLCTEGVNFFR